MSDGERVYTLQEAAERLHMPYRTLRDAVFAGKWPHRYISPRRRLMTEGDITEVLSMSHRPPVEAIPTSESRALRHSVKALLGAS